MLPEKFIETLRARHRACEDKIPVQSAKHIALFTEGDWLRRWNSQPLKRFVILEFDSRFGSPQPKAPAAFAVVIQLEIGVDAFGAVVQRHRQHRDFATLLIIREKLLDRLRNAGKAKLCPHRLKRRTDSQAIHARGLRRFRRPRDAPRVAPARRGDYRAWQ